MRYSVSPHMKPASRGPNPMEKRTALTPSHFPTSRCPSSWKKTITLISTANAIRVMPADCIQEPISSSVMCMAGISSRPSAKPGEGTCTEEDKRGGEEERVDAVEEPSVPGQKAAGVLRSVGALEHRLAQVAERADHAGAHADRRRPPPGQ